jgi:hypothetical protein
MCGPCWARHDADRAFTNPAKSPTGDERSRRGDYAGGPRGRRRQVHTQRGGGGGQVDMPRVDPTRRQRGTRSPPGNGVYGGRWPGCCVGRGVVPSASDNKAGGAHSTGGSSRCTHGGDLSAPGGTTGAHGRVSRTRRPTTCADIVSNVTTTTTTTAAAAAGRTPQRTERTPQHTGKI